MPVNIYKVNRDTLENENIAWLCDGEWLLRPQIEALATWLAHSAATLPPAEYVADLGFCWRRSALGGGPVLEPSSMECMARIGMRLFLSEYPGFAEGE